MLRSFAGCARKGECRSQSIEVLKVLSGLGDSGDLGLYCQEFTTGMSRSFGFWGIGVYVSGSLPRAST